MYINQKEKMNVDIIMLIDLYNKYNIKIGEGIFFLFMKLKFHSFPGIWENNVFQS